MNEGMLLSCCYCVIISIYYESQKKKKVKKKKETDRSQKSSAFIEILRKLNLKKFNIGDSHKMAEE